MARKKVSEFAAKQLLYKSVALPYRGLAFDVTKDNSDTLEKLDPTKKYVIKVDQGIKKRMKSGLVSLDKTPQQAIEVINSLQKKGYTHFIIEPFLPHPANSEKYLSIERTREGLQVLYSEKGGIDIEENQKDIQTFLIPQGKERKQIPAILGIDNSIFQNLLQAFDDHYFSFLEINPLVVLENTCYFLDVAAEVDSAGEFFIHNSWTNDDVRDGHLKKKTEEENAIATLAQKSQASFALTVLNKDGSIFMLLSGGGASIVLADEVYNLGYGKELANYGEYSGNPNAEEVYLYTKNILSLLLHSKAKQKVLVIAGGVANFTDVRVTFKGIIKAVDEAKEQLQKQHIKIFVRRGGPHQEDGLALMKNFLEKNHLLGLVSNQTTALPEVIAKAIAALT